MDTMKKRRAPYRLVDSGQEQDPYADWERVPGVIQLSPWVWLALVVLVLLVLLAFGFSLATFVISLNARAQIEHALKQ